MRERYEIGEQKHIQRNHRRIQNLLQMMIPAYNKTFRDGNPFQTDFFPEEDTTKSYSGFEPSRLQAEGHSHHTGWATYVQISSIFVNSSSVKLQRSPAFNFDEISLVTRALITLYCSYRSFMTSLGFGGKE
ncbi:hypothetical protein TNCV_1264841 [Trichonephila clavipes]|nr:hypothetical protein TNCV_1264841 [Trichonephila clavipes]